MLLTLLDVPHATRERRRRTPGVEEIPLSERAAIAAVAREDEDPACGSRCREAEDPAASGESPARTMTGVRAQATPMLRDIAPTGLASAKARA